MTLSQLIRSVMTAERLSYRRLEQRALAKGHVMSFSHFQQLVKRARLADLPDDKTIRAIAAALDVTLETVQLAALESRGWKIHRPCPAGDGCCIVLAAQSLTPQEVAQVREAAQRAVRTIMEARPVEHSATAGTLPRPRAHVQSRR